MAPTQNNGLTNFTDKVPDTRDQTKEFLNDLESGKVQLGRSESLIFWWIGINSLDAIWVETCGPQPDHRAGASDRNDALFLEAIRRTDRQINEVRDQILGLSSTLSEKGKGELASIVVTTPHVSSAPMQKGYVNDWSKGNQKLAKDYLNLLDIIIEHYNDLIIELIVTTLAKIRDLKGFFKELELDVGRRNLNVRVYDVVELWNRVRNSPSDDYIHLSPKLQILIAEEIINVQELSSQAKLNLLTNTEDESGQSSDQRKLISKQERPYSAFRDYQYPQDFGIEPHLVKQVP
ncbi:expressed protein [Phakopsora pachyrhizi]|uniref:Expressed protein n=1 Tax=Phakopsora pachyrhizi TaxID=170000 RepID=A0AAV0B303_PHAPC|nr:expressed protein [Phakopsora pachyrhizi]